LNNQATSKVITNGNSALSNGLERVADVNIYAGDQIVRRSPALQLTRDAKRGNQAGLNQILFTELGLKEGDAVRVSQGDQSVDLPASLEVNLASGAVRISAGTMPSAKLGPMFGPITVSKV
jgi:NADH-quinone oxidoreductase subunit G